MEYTYQFNSSAFSRDLTIHTSLFRGRLPEKLLKNAGTPLITHQGYVHKNPLPRNISHSASYSILA